MATDNSLVSFAEPNHWQRLLQKDPTLTEAMIDETFEEFLRSIEDEACTHHQDVINHLFSKDDFEVFGIAFDTDKKQDYRWIKPKKEPFKFRESEDVVVVDDQGKPMTPDFSLGKRSELDTTFPYLKTKAAKEYPYSFYVSKDHQLMTICVEHQHLWSYQLKVDGILMTPSHRKDHEVKCHVTLSSGWHVLSILALEESLIKKIHFCYIHPNRGI